MRLVAQNATWLHLFDWMSSTYVQVSCLWVVICHHFRTFFTCILSSSLFYSSFSLFCSLSFCSHFVFRNLSFCWKIGGMREWGMLWKRPLLLLLLCLAATSSTERREGELVPFFKRKNWNLFCRGWCCKTLS